MLTGAAENGDFIPSIQPHRRIAAADLAAVASWLCFELVYVRLFRNVPFQWVQLPELQQCDLSAAAPLPASSRRNRLIRSKWEVPDKPDRLRP